MAYARIRLPANGRSATCGIGCRIDIEITMLTVAQKANILRKAGIPVPDAPEKGPAGGGEESARTEAAEAWERTVNVVFVTYAAARAAKSLRDAEEARQLQMLRQLAGGVSGARRQLHRA